MRGKCWKNCPGARTPSSPACAHSLPDAERREFLETTQVHFGALMRRKSFAIFPAGSRSTKPALYAIQGRAGRYIPRIEGANYNVVGLPSRASARRLPNSVWSDEEFAE